MQLLAPRHHAKFEPRAPRKFATRGRPFSKPAPRRHPVVLLVDDDCTVLESLRRVFVQNGLHVVTAATGEEARVQIATLHPDLVVTDLCMSAVSGWDLVFHHHLHDPGLPFMVITALPVGEAGGVEKIAAGFFQKPLDLEALLAAIHARLASPRAAFAEKTNPSKL